MVADGYVLVVWLEGVFFAAEEDADVEGVVEACVEVGVVADFHWHVVLAFLEWDEGFGL